jgi:hypothetical protein
MPCHSRRPQSGRSGSRERRPRWLGPCIPRQTFDQPGNDERAVPQRALEHGAFRPPPSSRAERRDPGERGAPGDSWVASSPQPVERRASFTALSLLAMTFHLNAPWPNGAYPRARTRPPSPPRPRLSRQPRLYRARRRSTGPWQGSERRSFAPPDRRSARRPNRSWR